MVRTAGWLSVNLDQSDFRTFGLIIAIFAAIGVGLGLTGFVTMEFAQQQFGAGPDSSEFARSLSQLFVGIIFFMSAVVTFFAGPISAGIGGVTSGVRVQGRNKGALLGGAGSFIGFYVMVILALGIMSMALGGGGGGTGNASNPSQSIDIGKNIGTLLKASLPTGITGVLAGVIGTDISK